MLFRLIVLVLLCISVLSWSILLTTAEREALTPCEKKKQEEQAQQRQQDKASSLPSDSLIANGETLYTKGPDGTLVPVDPNVPSSAPYYAIDPATGDLVETDATGVPLQSGMMTEDIELKTLLQMLKIKEQTIDGAKDNVDNAHKLNQKRQAGIQNQAGIIGNSRNMLGSNAAIIANQQKSFIDRQGTLEDMTEKLKNSVSNARQISAQLNARAAEYTGLCFTPSPAPAPSFAPAPAPSFAPAPGPSFAPAPGPSFAPAPGPSFAPAPAPSFAPPEPQPINACHSDRMGGVCGNKIVDRSTNEMAELRQDGEFVVTSAVGNVKFSSYTNSIGKPPYRLLMQPDGLLVVKDVTDAVIWSAGERNRPGFEGPYKATMRSDRILVITDAKDQVLWTTSPADNDYQDLRAKFMPLSPIENIKQIPLSGPAPENKDLPQPTDGCRSDHMSGVCNERFTDKTNKYTAALQKSGLVIERNDLRLHIFQSHDIRYDKGTDPFQLTMRNNGRLVITDADKKVLWTSSLVRDTGKAPYEAKLREDGVLEIKDAEGTSIWKSIL